MPRDSADPRIFVSYARSDGEAFARDLAREAGGSRFLPLARPPGHGGRPRLVAADHRGDRHGRVPGPGDDAGGAALRGRPPRVALRPPAGPLRRAGHGRQAARLLEPAALDGERAFLRPRHRGAGKALHPPAREPLHHAARADDGAATARRLRAPPGGVRRPQGSPARPEGRARRHHLRAEGCGRLRQDHAGQGAVRRRCDPGCLP